MKHSLLSKKRIQNIKAQGYFGYSDQQISDLSVGNRFAYSFCSILLTIGVLTVNIPLLSFMLLIASLGIVMPNHPFDYIYNSFIAGLLGRPKLPSRSKQLKFACTMASMTIALTIYFFASSYLLAGYLAGLSIVFASAFVSITDYCIPSVIYNKIYGIKLSV